MPPASVSVAKEGNAQDQPPPTTDQVTVTKPADRDEILSSQSSPNGSESNNSKNSTTYKAKKPIWWNRLGGGNKPTKGQKRAIQAMSTTHQLARLAYQETYDWEKVFGAVNCKSNQPWLEIGCGTGENLLCLAEQYPQQPLIGAEMHACGYGPCFQYLFHATVRKRYWRRTITLFSAEWKTQYPTQDESKTRVLDYQDDSYYSINETTNDGGSPYPNVRLFMGNGVKVLQAAPDASLSVIMVTFPDPFPNQASYRLLQFGVLDEIVRVLQPDGGGRLVVATDHDGHATWVQSQMEQHDYPWKQVLAAGVPSSSSSSNADDADVVALRLLYLPAVSKYELKGWQEGRTTKLLIYER